MQIDLLLRHILSDLLKHLPNGEVLSIVASAAMLIHLIVPFILRMQVLTKYINPYAENHRGSWFATTGAIICFVLTVINFIPFIDVLLEFIPCLFNFPIAIILPIVFYTMQNDLPVSIKLFLFLVFIYAIIFATCGLFRTFFQLKKHYEKVDIFSCREL